MNSVTKIIVGLVVLIAGVGLAFATPIIGLVSPLLAVGKHNDDIHQRGIVKTSVDEGIFSAVLKTEGPSTVSTQDFSIAAGGQNGWHSHPGLVIVTLISGQLQWYDENCNTTIYNAGDSWVEGSQLHAFRNIGTVSLHGIAVFITAQGQALRTDRPVPACGAGLGL